VTAEEEDARLRAEIRVVTARLRSTCADWPTELFEQMVRRIAHVTLKYNGVLSLSTYDRRTADRVIDELKAALELSERSPHHDDLPATNDSKSAAAIGRAK